ncbi:MerR family transcriptional regulator [Dorea sp. D27]|jgi:DNA-binding transcriptional MerR regulator|uniref:MerR family transcriptional regulator n=1 Tax=Dorea sp. D27 TaxID=658665 RepID=UPI000673A8E6|nr:MerR family transcriptional regulator [Dorea sp. D27]KMZ54610.1 transcriptional regulator, MerR family [Dorea sp. D27]
MFYTVGEMADKLNVAPSTLRYYDKEGLLPFVERSSGGIRMFKEEDFQWLSIIECLKKTGLPIKEIKTFIDWCMEGDGTIAQRLELMQKQRETVKKQIAQMQETLAVLDYKCWYYETAKEAGTCAIHDTLSEEDIPAEFRTVKRKSITLD